MRNTILVVTLLALPGVCIPRAMAGEVADDEEVTKMAKEHYKLGLDAYQAGKYDVAIKELKMAYLLKHIPALLLNLAATYRKMGDNAQAISFYQKYLEEAPADAKDRPEVEKALNEVKPGAEIPKGTAPVEKPAEPKAAPAEEESRTATTAKEFSHQIIDAAPPEMPIDVRVTMPVMKGVKVYTFYRVPGEAEFRQVLMKRHGSEKVGRIPAKVVTGTSIQYYVEARDPSGNVVRAAGSQGSPNIIMIDPSAKPVMIASMDEQQNEERAQEQNEEEAPPPPRPTKRHRDLEDEEAPLTGQLAEEHPRRHTAPKRNSKYGTVFWAGVGLAAGGAAIGIGLGAAGFSQASTYSDLVSMDAHKLNTSVTPNAPFRFNDPTAKGSDDKSFEASGKLYDSLGIAGTVIGSALVVTGGIMMLYDAVLKNRSTEEQRPKRRRRPVRVEEDAAAPSWYILPQAGPRGAGLGGGFNF